jgi:polar amino acid transport system substrate-binding protein
MKRREFLTAAGGAALLGSIPSLAVAATTVADIKAAGVLRIGVEATYVPFTFRRDGKIIGYDPDLADLIAGAIGVKAELVDTQWSGVIPALYAGKFDIIMTSLSYTKDRMERVGYSIPYAEASQALLIRSADAAKLKSVNDLAGKIVATKLGSPSEIIAKKANEELIARNGKGFAEIRVFNDDPSRYLALSQGRVDGVFNTLPTLSLVLKDQPGTFALIRGVGGDNWAGIATRKEDTELVAMLNTQIRRLKANGEIYKLQEKWFGFPMNLPDTLPSL